MRQVARDTAGVVEGSFVSAQYPGRTEFLSALSESTALASSEELERLWLVLLEEMIQSGQVVKFPATVLDPDGAESRRDVVRVGVFNAVSQGQYLRYLPETGQLAELPRQPERGFRNAAQDLEELSEGYAAFGVDPSRGAILAALVQAPDVWERIQQGGVVGYVILGVGLLALGLSVERGFYLWREGQRMEAQRVSGTLKSDNALGRVMMVYDRESVLALETLEARLDEAIIETDAAPRTRPVDARHPRRHGPVAGTARHGDRHDRDLPVHHPVRRGRTPASCRTAFPRRWSRPSSG